MASKIADRTTFVRSFAIETRMTPHEFETQYNKQRAREEASGAVR
jgi:hypothetical protein